MRFPLCINHQTLSQNIEDQELFFCLSRDDPQANDEDAYLGRKQPHLQNLNDCSGVGECVWGGT